MHRHLITNSHSRLTLTFSQSSFLLSVSAGSSRYAWFCIAFIPIFWTILVLFLIDIFQKNTFHFPQTLALLDISALEYIGKIFTLLQVLHLYNKVVDMFILIIDMHICGGNHYELLCSLSV